MKLRQEQICGRSLPTAIYCTALDGSGAVLFTVKEPQKAEKTMAPGRMLET